MDAVFNEKGEMIPENTPVELPIGYEHPEELKSMIRRMVTDAAFVAAQDAQGFDSEEEADDFDVMSEEDGEDRSEHEFTEMQQEEVHEERRKRKEKRDEKVEKPVDKPVDKPELVNVAQ